MRNYEKRKASTMSLPVEKRLCRNNNPVAPAAQFSLLSRGNSGITVVIMISSVGL